MKFNYKPCPSDIEFAQQMIRCAANRARWSIPRSLVIFEINHDHKALIQVGGPTVGDDAESELDMNGAVFAKVGYKVVRFGQNPDDVPAPDQERHWEQFRRQELQ